MPGRSPESWKEGSSYCKAVGVTRLQHSLGQCQLECPHAVSRHSLGARGGPGACGPQAATLLRVPSSSARPGSVCLASWGSDPSTFSVLTQIQLQLPEEKAGLKLSENIKKEQICLVLDDWKKKLNQTFSKAKEWNSLRTENCLHWNATKWLLYTNM